MPYAYTLLTIKFNNFEMFGSLYYLLNIGLPTIKNPQSMTFQQKRLFPFLLYSLLHGAKGLRRVATCRVGGAKFKTFLIKFRAFIITNSKSPNIFRRKIKIYAIVLHMQLTKSIFNKRMSDFEEYAFNSQTLAVMDTTLLKKP